MTKTCGKCFTEKPLSDFYQFRGGPHGHCKPCGLLCNACNRGIGWLNHQPDRLMAAVDYLQGAPA